MIFNDLLSSIAKLIGQPKLIEALTSLGVPAGPIPFLALCEFAGVIGLLIGLWYAPLGVAAAIGVLTLRRRASARTCEAGTTVGRRRWSSAVLAAVMPALRGASM